MEKNVGECPDCASPNIVRSELREQTICRDCGLIFEPFAAGSPQKKVARRK